MDPACSVSTMARKKPTQDSVFTALTIVAHNLPNQNPLRLLMALCPGEPPFGVSLLLFFTCHAFLVPVLVDIADAY